MSAGLYSGVSGLALGIGLYRNVSGLWGGASGLIDGFGGSDPYSGASLYLNFLNPVLDPRITFSRGTNATLIDSTGRLTYAPNNLLTFTEQFGNVIWTQANITRVDGVTDPNGGSNACRITATATNATFQQIGASVSANAIGSFWIRRVSGTGVINLVAPNGGFSAPLSVTSTWQRFSALELNRAGVVFAGVRITTIGDAVEIAFPQAEAVTYQTTPSTYVATAASAYYGPRFDYDPVTLAPRGLLIEEARTNLLLRSQAFSNWTVVGLNAFGAGSSETAIVSPDGTLTGNFLQENSATSRHFVTRTVTGASSSTVYTFGAFVKFASRRYVVLAIGSSLSGTTNNSYSLVFDVQNGVFVSASNTTGTPSATAYSITNFGNGWYRVNVTMQSGASDNVVFGSLALSDSATPSYVGEVPSYTGNGTSGSYFWGAQLEAGSFATSYIPTVASTVTRNADVATMTGTNFSSWYNQSEGTFVYNATSVSKNSTTGPWQVFVTAGNNSNSMYSAFADTRQLRVYDGSAVEQVAIASSAVTALQYAKVAAAYKLNDFAVSANGGTVATDNSGTVPAPTQMFIGGNNGSFNGWVAQIAYFNTRLPNAQLQTLTAPSLATTLSLDFTSGSYNVGF